MLARASSYNYEYGADLQLAPINVTKNNIFARRVSDLETKPKEEKTKHDSHSTSLIRGILTNMGYPCRVTAEIADFGARFQIEINSVVGQK
ncbi:unnamed protein product [Rotaria sp. Silwood2]|nr:unnamed protein product [Rotaria sp. Silwood2]CAF2548036.1 unnamed protein product [Rotaria sp. Silwood2]CAF4311186.1 unnamed protein product [Rotaria sp. Silwood2]CAF4377548.1 unnamed protein product [Rotaria sp. Silwood2]